MTEQRVEHEPFDRLTSLCAEMTTVLDTEENADVQAVIFLMADERGGIQTHGYPDLNDAMVDLFVHLRAMFRATGRDLEFIAVPQSPEGL